ncbi:cytosine permease [Pseudomonas sp. RAC1]|uniref:cytosine permease n=1 Tax=Pseudomonas sp. RAC1 TaxID=3064900 RepID=UPI002720CECB|nr:cytosine permease [Pseudomonas sp. RAC1]MDV9032683.1 cytosine permease [Pseudomonas sp. RAC1]
MTSAAPAAPLIEKHTIGYVPPEDRHGKVKDLFTLWFGGNIAPLPIVTGALGVQLFHLNLVWGIVAILVGHLLGGVLMALHSAQGPQMGIAQMIQSRAQFGSLGALLVVVIAGVMYIGFFASNIVLAGKSLHGVVDSVPVPDGGRYGRYNPQALIAYTIGILVQIPFMNTPLYVGPVSAHIDGADLSWLVGLAVTTPLYAWLASRDSAYRRRQRGTELATGH